MRTLIVDDHALFSAGLRLLLADDHDGALDDIVRCESGEQALRHAEGGRFDMVLLDWNLGGGLAGAALVRALKERLPAAPVVIVSGESTPQVVREAIDAGAAGFVPKESSPELMQDALHMACHGGIYLPLAALQAAAGSAAASPPAPQPGGLPQDITQAFPVLTARQADVLSQVVRGLSNKEIARVLGISDGTVKQHLGTVYRELGVDSRTEAVYLMARRGVRLC